MNPKVDAYLADGCGRCPLYQTPNCKVHTWAEELQALRTILLESGLKEELNWRQPCYTFNGHNVAIMSTLKDYSFISFFKGALLKDPKKRLVSPGKNSQAVRLLRYTDVRQIQEQQSMIRSYIQEAIEIEQRGLRVELKGHPGYKVPEELLQRFREDTALKEAFEALTPGRQRGYYLYFSESVQSKTRESRIDKCRQRIFSGKGYNER